MEERGWGAGWRGFGVWGAGVVEGGGWSFLLRGACCCASEVSVSGECVLV